jgi:hypothetical protein
MVPNKLPEVGTAGVLSFLEQEIKLTPNSKTTKE